MTAPASAPQDAPNPFTGILLKVISVGVLMGLTSSVKALDGEIPTVEVLFFRSFFALPPIVIWLALRGELPGGLRTPNPMGHVWRSLAGMAAMGCMFMALSLLPLTEVVAITYAAPLFITVFAAIFLGERLRLYRMAAIGLGFAGVLLVMAPRLLGEDPGAAEAAARWGSPALGALIALTAAVMMGLAQTFVRGLSKTETTAAIVFWFTAACTVMAGLALPFAWKTPDAEQWLLLIAGGTAGGVGQILLTSSYRYAEAAVIAPFEYVSMILAVAIGFFLFGEAPTLVVIAGAALVTVSGILIIWRERRLGIERRASRSARTPPFG
ncbi:DMT family transporter [Albimonas sp. CAU 1670]|uniref:DMT family transporter n=1 Tax=Albimonas sp. CAU 1670 TaxID=3032599 RepID=UPI0023DA0366|nr:DMT family transporter [Albimonas sp. CAU 1670]MDF2235849.1 DMT family transporter [Albimonas sp. CAU 1670]